MKEVILITGSSRGIGAATALLAARQGYAVCINYVRDKESADALCARIREEGFEAIAVQADVAEEADVERLFREVDARLGTITALVNNVGVLEQKCRLIDMSVQRMERVLRTNVISYFLCSQQAVRRMSTATGGQGGRIVNVSSVAARLGGSAEYVDYAASKGAIDTLTVGLAKEVALDGIRVNGVRPGLIYTDIHASGGEAGRVDRLAAGVPVQRGGQPGEVADAILYLLSPAASYVTGVLLDVSGGR